MTHAELLVLSRESVIEFVLAHPPVLLRLLEGVAAQARALAEDSARIAYRPIRERLAIKLLELASTHGQPDGDRIRMALDISQSALAGMIGASRENVNRALRAQRRRRSRGPQGPHRPPASPPAVPRRQRLLPAVPAQPATTRQPGTPRHMTTQA